VLELRPTCEHCNKALPPEALEARICSFECTFCATCVDGILPSHHGLPKTNVPALAAHVYAPSNPCWKSMPVTWHFFPIVPSQL
jgi:hypothetical protein